MTEKVGICEDCEHLELSDNVAVAGPVIVTNTEGSQTRKAGKLPDWVDRQQVAVQGQCLQVMFIQTFAILEENSHYRQIDKRQDNFSCIYHPDF